MPAGLEVYKADGSLQLSITDRTSLVMGSGNAGPVPPLDANNPNLIRVNWPGIRNDGRWYVICLDYTVVRIYTDYFTIQRYEYWPPISGDVLYSVVRT